jgi:hypothetical protein
MKICIRSIFNTYMVSPLYYYWKWSVYIMHVLTGIHIIQCSDWEIMLLTRKCKNMKCDQNFKPSGTKTERNKLVPHIRLVMLLVFSSTHDHENSFGRFRMWSMLYNLWRYRTVCQILWELCFIFACYFNFVALHSCFNICRHVRVW